MAESTINVNVNITGGAGTTGGGGKTTPPVNDVRTIFDLQKKLKQEVKNTASATGEWSEKTIKAKKELEEVNKKIAKLNALGRENKNTWGAALSSYQFKFNALGNIIANFTSAAVNMLKEFGKTFVTISKDFEFAMSGVKAITMATDSEFKSLKNDAIRLGGATIYTAREISGLQEELAKLGFTVTEIRAATDGVVALAAATGEDLSQSALIAGTIIRGFGLNAMDLTRVVDVMSQSFNDSALDLYKFAETMKYVAPIASKVGFSVEETTVLMEKLADQGVVASQAGTGLRNIMLRLSDSSSKLSKAMGGSVKTLPELILGLRKLKEQGIDATSALKLVDRYSVTAFLGLINASDKLWESYTKLNESFGVAKKMSEIRMDNFAGSIEKLSGAWDSFTLTVNKGNGILRVAVDVIRKLVEGVTKIFQSYEQAQMIASNERLLKFRETLDSEIQNIRKTNIDKITLLNNQLAQEKISREDFSKSVREIEKEQSLAINNLTSQRLKEQLDNEKKILNERELAYKAYKKRFDSAETDAIKNEILRDYAAAETRRNVQQNFVDDITKLINQNELEKASLMTDYSSDEVNLAEDTASKIAKLRIELMQDGLNKELAIVNAYYDNLKEEAIKYGLDYSALEDERRRKLFEKEQEYYENQRALVVLEANKRRLEQREWYIANFGFPPEDLPVDVKIEIQKLAEKTSEEIRKQTKLAESRFAKTTDIKTSRSEAPTIWERIGFTDLSLEQKQALEKGVNFLTSELQKIADREMEIADRRVENSERVVEQLQRDLEIEVALAEKGFANNVSLKQKELAEAKKAQDQALAKQAEAVKKQQQIESLLQFVNMTSAVSGILKQTFTKLDPVTATLVSLGATGVLFGLFNAFKSQAKDETKYAEGGEIVGAKHSQGGVPIEAEGGEYVVKASAYAKHADLVQAINNDNLGQVYSTLNKDLSVSLDDKKYEKMMGKYFGNSKRTYYNGYYVEQSGNRRRTIRYANL